MPVHPDFHQVPGNKNLYTNGAGQTVTRHRARKLGDAFYGSKPGANSATDNKWFNKWSSHNVGREALANARAKAHAEGRPFNAARFKAEATAARNQKPGKNGTPGGPAWQRFHDEYGLNEGDDTWRES